MSDERTTETGEEQQAVAEERAAAPEAGAAGDGASSTVEEADPVDTVDADGAAAEEEREDAVEDGGAAEGQVDESTEQLEALQAELNALNERHLRLAAEFDNYRKRVGREREELRTRAQADLSTDLLEVLDDLQRVAGYEADATSVEALLEGVELVEKKLRHTMESLGLEPIRAEGELFDPSTMEALMTLPAEHPEEDDVVADVFQPGYRFQDILIRPARVRVKKYEDSAGTER